MYLEASEVLNSWCAQDANAGFRSPFIIATVDRIVEGVILLWPSESKMESPSFMKMLAKNIVLASCFLFKQIIRSYQSKQTNIP